MEPMREKAAATITLRSARPDDAQRLGQICHDAFEAIAAQHNYPKDFPNVEAAVGLMNMMIGHPYVYSVVAEVNGEAVGSNFLWEGDEVAGVGPITVDVKLQNAQIGRMLMNDVMQHSEERNSRSVRLVQAAYHNRSLSLYTKLGFDVVEPLSVINGTPIRTKIDGTSVRAMTAEDITAADELCRRIHGHTRHSELAFAVEQGSAQMVERDGRLTGYTTGVGFFTHTVAESNQDLIALIAAAEAFPGPGFLLPTRNGEVLRWCLNNGLRIVIPASLMSKGFYQEPRGSFLPSVLY